MKIIFNTLCLIALVVFSLQAQTDKEPVAPPYLQYIHSEWVDSVFNTLSPKERLAQLFMVAAYSNKDKALEDSIASLVKDLKIGGLIFFQGGPVRQAHLTNRYQDSAAVPLLIAMDAEWGLGMRLDSTMNFPYQMTLGAIRNDSLIYAMGAEIARQLKRLGVHINFAPVVDVNNNAANPVINYRSFGEDPDKVSQKGLAYMKGLQDNFVLASAKHFPGHGDTDVDSHLALPVIPHDRERLDSIELYPFKELINNGLGSVMVAHLSVPHLDSTKNQASTLSKPIVTGLLKEELNFTGLAFTDAMRMKGVADYYPPGIADAKALLAGNDMILMPRDAFIAIEEIGKALERGEITQAVIDERCRKVLALKQWVGLDHYSPVETAHLIKDLNSIEAELLHQKITEASLTLLNNEEGLIPLERLDTLKIATISVGTNQVSEFQKLLGEYTKVSHFFLPDSSTHEMIDLFRDGLKSYNLVIVGLHETGTRPRNQLEISPAMEVFLSELATSGKAIFALFRNAYLLDKYPAVEQANGLIVTYEDNKNAEQLAAQLIFGGVGASGQLPVTVNEKFKAGDGLITPGGKRFGYTLPEAVGMSSEVLQNIDSLAWEAIRERATPGLVVLAAKDGKVVYEKAFGYHTYDSLAPVKSTDLYDFASVSKITTALPALMKLHDEGKFELDATLAKYLPYFKRSDKGDLTFREILAHYARLKPWIPYWQSTLRKNGTFKWFTFKEDSSKRFPIKITDHLYLHRRYKKKIYKAIKKSPLNEEKEYVYSGLSFYLYPDIIEKATGQDYATFLKETFYRPLGAYSLTFNPMKEFPLSRIVPTEYDSLFRKVQIHGRVHDEGAAMMGGVSSNAGLFGKAIDLAKIMQMYLQKGAYGGHRYISDSTVTEFARCQYCEEGNRRGIGFDKPNIEYIPDGNTAKDASKLSFGHSGFTGILTWVDPKYNLVYVFLSNRVYPTRENHILYDLNTRTDIQQVLYDAIKAESGLQDHLYINLHD